MTPAERFRRQLEADDLARLLVSCPECGTLCRRYRGHAWDGQVFDLSLYHASLEGLPDWACQSIERQGIGVTNGWSHRCPPTRAEMREDAT